jgi:hypothetical protein
MEVETLLPFAKTDTERFQLQQFFADWSQNFMLQHQVPTQTPLEASLKLKAEVINTRLYELARISDTGLMELISYMRELSSLLYVYNNETLLLQRKHGIHLINLRNQILWTSDVLERHIIAKYHIKATLGSGAPAAAGR